MKSIMHIHHHQLDFRHRCSKPPTIVSMSYSIIKMRDIRDSGNCQIYPIVHSIVSPASRLQCLLVLLFPFSFVDSKSGIEINNLRFPKVLLIAILNNIRSGV